MSNVQLVRQFLCWQLRDGLVQFVIDKTDTNDDVVDNITDVVVRLRLHAGDVASIGRRRRIHLRITGQ